MEGLTKVALADVYRFASEKTERVTQVLFATEVVILEEKETWFKIKIPVQLNYTGWIKKENIWLGKPPAYYDQKATVWKHLAALKEKPHESSNTILKVPLNTRLRVLEKVGGWSAVWMPGGREEAWLNEEDLGGGEPTSIKGKKTGEKIVRLAATFLGVPYLWGGITPEGFDCSGFVYTLYALQGYFLHRDADLQYRNDGLKVKESEICPGDLLYFYEDIAENPTHVGIYEGEQKFINASSSGEGVIIYSLEEGNWRLKMSGAKRVPVSG